LVHAQVAQLAAQVMRVCGRLGWTDSSWTLKLAGGLVARQPSLRTRLLEECAARGCAPREAVMVDPLVAVVQQALRLTAV
jgi:hypothetical protein